MLHLLALLILSAIFAVGCAVAVVGYAVVIHARATLRARRIRRDHGRRRGWVAL